MNVLISWDANTEGDLASYTVRVGTTPGVYTSNTVVNAPATSLQVNGLPDGVPVYATISASDIEAAESGNATPITMINPYISLAR